MKSEMKDEIKKGIFDWLTENPEIVARFFWFVVGFALGAIIL